MNKIIIPKSQLSSNVRFEKWLNSKVNDDRISSKYEKSEYSITKYIKPRLNFNNYYNSSNDIDVKYNDEYFGAMLDYELYNSEELFDNDLYLEGLNLCCQKYVLDEKNYNMIIPLNSNRFHCNMLFKRLVDYCKLNGCSYDYYDPKSDKVVMKQLFDKNIKLAFYKFCYDNSFKN